MTISNQIFFNKVKKHMLSMKRRSMYCGYCSYFNEDTGERCAIGGAIPIKFAKKLGNRQMPAAWLLEKEHTIFCGETGISEYLPKDAGLIEELQAAHDKGKPSTFAGKLRKIAKEYGLTY